MKYHCTISCDDEHIVELLHADSKDIVNPRAHYDVSKKAGKSIITIQASDSVSLQATLNGVCRVLTVHEKMHKIQ
ncbi:MAG: tRNA threonylcarbamoyladenosine modification (KEOPS) complex Pcc1 subunit [Candidatus Woesearchaeota archaeon]|jgi:tRNA threonylcarbamoyladenosine modification (KEOPS) complex  Pcc1 subunit